MKDFLKIILLSPCCCPLWASSASEIYANIETQYASELSCQTAHGTSALASYQTPQRLAVTVAEIGFYHPLSASWAVAAEVQHGRADRNQLSVQQQRETIEGVARAIWSDADLFQEKEPLFWSRAEISYTTEQQTIVAMGLIRLPEITAERSYYKPYLGSPATNRAIGGIFTNQGRHAGLALEGQMGSWSYQMSLWQQTPVKKLNTLPQQGIGASAGLTQASSLAQFENSYTTGYDRDGEAVLAPAILRQEDFSHGILHLGLAARVSYQQQLPGSLGGGYALGIGGSAASLNKPLLVNTLVSFQNEESGAQYSTVEFGSMAQWGIDASATLSNIQINLGYQSQYLIDKDDTFAPQGLRFLSPVARAFDRSGQARSLWVEAGCLIGGGNYELLAHYGAIAGVNMRPQEIVFEITGRYGMEHYRNISALLDPQGFADFSINSAATEVTNVPLVTIIEQTLAPLEQVTVLSVDNTGTYTTPVSQKDGRSYESKKTGWQISGAVFFSPQFCLRLQYQTVYHSYCRHQDNDLKNSPWHDSLNHRKVSMIKFGGQYAY